ncbi:hypothetical protein ACHAWT_003738 [Skeletonema menzelii]|eukprot:scaffold5812_cov139-Skeletonema_menzelii.AAC.8
MTILSEYELLRLEKIKRNEKRLAELGLDKAKQNLKRSATAGKTPTQKKKKRAAAVTQTPQRSSRRLKRQPVLYEPMMDDEIIRKIDAPHSKKKVARTATSKFRCEIPMDLKSSPLSQKEKDLITKKMEEDFLGKFEEYLTEVDELSHQNRRNVVRQITKLHMGEGITYESRSYGWPDGCYFMKGKVIGPTDDILHLMEIAQTCEDDWGQDHGNGWLLRHPLKKLYMFQQYHLR